MGACAGDAQGGAESVGALETRRVQGACGSCRKSPHERIQQRLCGWQAIRPQAQLESRCIGYKRHWRGQILSAPAFLLK